MAKKPPFFLPNKKKRLYTVYKGAMHAVPLYFKSPKAFLVGAVTARTAGDWPVLKRGNAPSQQKFAPISAASALSLKLADTLFPHRKHYLIGFVPSFYHDLRQNASVFTR